MKACPGHYSAGNPLDRCQPGTRSIEVAALQKQLDEAKQQVQEIAVKAIEGASGAKALSHINQIAMEQAKHRDQG